MANSSTELLYTRVKVRETKRERMEGNAQEIYIQVGDHCNMGPLIDQEGGNRRLIEKGSENHQCLKEELKYFVETEAYRKAKAILQSKHFLVITGYLGDGKTYLAKQLCLEKVELGWRCKLIREISEISQTDINVIYYLDDACGKMHFDKDRLDDILDFHRKPQFKEWLERNCVVCTIRRYFLKQEKTIEDEMAGSIVGCESDSLPRKEKLQIIEKHLERLQIHDKPTPKEIMSSLSKGLDGFPSYVDYYVSNRGMRSRVGIEFFKTPLPRMKEDILQMLTQDQALLGIFLMLIFGKGELNYHIQQVKLMNILSRCLGTNPPSFSTMVDAALKVDKIYLNVCFNGSIRFKNNMIEQAVQKVCVENYISIALDHFPFAVVCNVLRTKQNEFSNQFGIVVLSSMHFTALSRRFIAELLKGNVKIVCNHPSLHHQEVVNVFLYEIETSEYKSRILQTQEGYMKSGDTFNGSFLYWASFYNVQPLLRSLVTRPVILNYLVNRDPMWIRLQATASLLHALEHKMPQVIETKLISLGGEKCCPSKLRQFYNCDDCALFSRCDSCECVSSFDEETKILPETEDTVLHKACRCRCREFNTECKMSKCIGEIPGEELNDTLILQKGQDGQNAIEILYQSDCQNKDKFKEILLKACDNIDSPLIGDPIGDQRTSVVTNKGKSLSDIHHISKNENGDCKPIPKPDNQRFEANVDDEKNATFKSILTARENFIDKYKLLEKYVIKIEREINQPEDDSGNTCLHIACSSCAKDSGLTNTERIKLVELLMEKGADPRVTNTRDENALHVLMKCTCSVSSDISSILLEHKATGVDPNAKTIDNETVFAMLFSREECSKQNEIFAIVDMLLAKGASIDISSVLQTPIDQSSPLTKYFPNIQTLIHVIEKPGVSLNDETILFVVKVCLVHRYNQNSWDVMSSLHRSVSEKLASVANTLQPTDVENEQIHRLMTGDGKCTSMEMIFEIFAAIAGSPKAVEFLLRQKDTRTKLNINFIMKVLETRAIDEQTIAVIRFLLSVGQPMNSKHSRSDGHMLQQILEDQMGQDKLVKECLRILLEENLIDLFTEGALPLLWACSHKQSRYYVIKFLLEEGADVNQTDDDGNNSLHCMISSVKECARLKGDILHVLYLLHRNRIRLDHKNREGATPLHIAVQCLKTSYQADTIVDFLHALVNLLSETKPSEINSCWIHVCVTEGKHRVSEMVELLLNLGHDPNARLGGSNALHCACKQMNEDSVKTVSTLLNHVDDVNAQDQCGRTALHLLTECNQDDAPTCMQYRVYCMRLLLAIGADVNKANENGNTPIQKAMDEFELALGDPCANVLKFLHIRILMIYLLKAYDARFSLPFTEGTNTNDILNDILSEEKGKPSKSTQVLDKCTAMWRKRHRQASESKE